MPRTRFTKEFHDEAVRHARTSGRSRREIAEDLGVGLSTLRHWLNRHRERQIVDRPAEHQEDMATELKRLRRENEILHREREILKKATASTTPSGVIRHWIMSVEFSSKAGRIAPKPLSTKAEQVHLGMTAVFRSEEAPLNHNLADKVGTIVSVKLSTKHN